MRSLKKSGKYDLQKLKKDALGSLTAVGWIAAPLSTGWRKPRLAPNCSSPLRSSVEVRQPARRSR